jgi:hypothetical protein
MDIAIELIVRFFWKLIIDDDILRAINFFLTGYYAKKSFAKQSVKN